LELLSVFFFQAEDGIRDATVTGVQTCALPISPESYRSLPCCVDRNVNRRFDHIRIAVRAFIECVCKPISQEFARDRLLSVVGLRSSAAKPALPASVFFSRRRGARLSCCSLPVSSRYLGRDYVP